MGGLAAVIAVTLGRSSSSSNAVSFASLSVPEIRRDGNPQRRRQRAPRVYRPA